MVSRIVAVMVNGDLTIHAASGGLFNYITLCGLDGDDDDQAVVPLMPGAVIDCPQCYQLWQAWGAYRARDFKDAKPVRPRRAGRRMVRP